MLTARESRDAIMLTSFNRQMQVESREGKCRVVGCCCKDEKSESKKSNIIEDILTLVGACVDDRLLAPQ